MPENLIANILSMEKAVDICRRSSRIGPLGSLNSFYFRILVLVAMSALALPIRSIRVAQGQESCANPLANAEWQDVLTVSITDPPPDFILYINQTMNVAATVVDKLQFSNNGGSTWYDYSSGNGITTTPNWTLQWSDNIGGTFANAFSNSTTYTAPDYSSSANRALIITATASEVTPYAYMGHPALAAPQVQANLAGKNAAVTVKHDQNVNGNIGNLPQYPFNWNPDPVDKTPLLKIDGGGKLGWLTPNNPAGCDQYAGGTYVQATDPNGPVQKSDWHQKKWGSDTSTRKNGQQKIHFNKPQNAPVDDRPIVPGGNYQYWDNFEFGDTPGIEVGVTNDGATLVDSAEHFDMHYITCKEVNGVPISNEDTWNVKLDLNNNLVPGNEQWVPAQQHTP